MANYKGIKFNNSTEEFKRWTKEFPPLDPGAVKKQSFKRVTLDNGTTAYCELQLVKGFLSGDAFISQNFRLYDEENKDFDSFRFDEEEKLKDHDAFKKQYSAFLSKNKNILGGDL